MASLKDLLTPASSKVIDKILEVQKAQEAERQKLHEENEKRFYSEHGFKTLDEMISWVKAGHVAFMKEDFEMPLYLRAKKENDGSWLFIFHTFENDEIDMSYSTTKTYNEDEICAHKFWSDINNYGYLENWHMNTKLEVMFI